MRMAKPDRGSGELERINLQEDNEVRYWTSELGVSKQSLETAVKAVGDLAEDVRTYLARQVTRS
jgi:Protein of unknown function (DUF3606)